MDDDWLEPAYLDDAFDAMLREVGRVYAPVMIANARAIATGADRFKASVDGVSWTQATVNYQGKCLRWLREAFISADPSAQAVIADRLRPRAAARC